MKYLQIKVTIHNMLAQISFWLIESQDHHRMYVTDSVTYENVNNILQQNPFKANQELFDSVLTFW